MYNYGVAPCVGAWIEISGAQSVGNRLQGRSLVGTWIEMSLMPEKYASPSVALCIGA